MIKPLPIAAIPAKDLLQPDEYPRVDHLVTEDDTPVDNLLAEKQARLLMETLRHAGPALKKGQKFQAMMNVGLFYSIRAPGLVPDFLYSVDFELLPDGWREKEGRSYFPWILGKMPDLVLEIVANHEGGEEDPNCKHMPACVFPITSSVILWNGSDHGSCASIN